MVASKVTISQETRAKLDNPILTKAKKSKLREELIKDYIQARRGGIATKQQLIAAAGFDPNARSNSYASGIAFLRRMMKHDIISHDNTNKFKKVWTVKEASKVSPTPAQVAESIVKPPVVVELKEFEKVNSVQLVDMAKEFAWKQNSDSLRDFIQYVENAIK
jgi:hypothetical protein